MKNHAMLHGTVVHSSVYSRLDRATGQLTYNHVRVVARQPGRDGQEWEAVHICGPGNDGASRANLIRARLKVGIQCQAYGECVIVRTPAVAGLPQLVLRGVSWIRGGEAPHWHEPAPATLNAIQRLFGARQPAGDAAA